MINRPRQFFFAISLWVAAASHAEVVNSTADLNQHRRISDYMYSKEKQQVLFKLALEQDKKFGLHEGCNSGRRIEPYSASIFSPIDFPDDKQNPVKGIWNLRYQFHRCGESKFYNAIFLANENAEEPEARPYFPGSSAASPQLIHDTMLSAIVAGLMKADAKDCEEYEMFDMRVSQPPHELKEGRVKHLGVWSEVWAFRFCGKMTDVEVQFIPDANGGGTTYRIPQ